MTLQIGVQTEFRMQRRGAATLRAGIVLPQAAAQDPKFETNQTPLQRPQVAPRPWPELPLPGQVIPLPTGLRVNREQP